MALKKLPSSLCPPGQNGTLEDLSRLEVHYLPVLGDDVGDLVGLVVVARDAEIR